MWNHYFSSISHKFSCFAEPKTQLEITTNCYIYSCICHNINKTSIVVKKISIDILIEASKFISCYEPDTGGALFFDFSKNSKFVAKRLCFVLCNAGSRSYACHITCFENNCFSIFEESCFDRLGSFKEDSSDGIKVDYMNLKLDNVNVSSCWSNLFSFASVRDLSGSCCYAIFSHCQCEGINHIINSKFSFSCCYFDDVVPAGNQSFGVAYPIGKSEVLISLSYFEPSENILLAAEGNGRVICLMCRGSPIKQEGCSISFESAEILEFTMPKNIDACNRNNIKHSKASFAHNTKLLIVVAALALIK